MLPNEAILNAGVQGHVELSVCGEDFNFTTIPDGTG